MQQAAGGNIHVRNPPADRAPAGQNSAHWPGMRRPSLKECAVSYLYKTMQSPVGQLTLVGSDRGLAAVLWEDDDPSRVRLG